MTHKNQSKFIIEIETPKLMSKISELRIRLVNITVHVLHNLMAGLSDHYGTL